MLFRSARKTGDPTRDVPAAVSAKVEALGVELEGDEGQRMDRVFGEALPSGLVMGTA